MRSGALAEARLDEALRETGVSVAKWWALRQLSRAGSPVALSKLAEILDCAKSNATQLVDRLATEGLARRVPDPADGRGVMCEITDKGRSLYNEGLRALSEVDAELAELYPTDDFRRLLGLLERLEPAGNRR